MAEDNNDLAIAFLLVVLFLLLCFGIFSPKKSRHNQRDTTRLDSDSDCFDNFVCDPVDSEPPSPCREYQCKPEPPSPCREYQYQCQPQPPAPIQCCLGFQGPRGFQGALTGGGGSQGFQGAVGALGFQGPTGAGSQGLQGITGTAGIPGVQGTQGTQGTTGVGTQGSQGITGPVGETGATGPTGVTGATGTGGAGLVEFAGFYGMPAGAGNSAAIDYPATIAASAASPSVAAGSAINFPRLMIPTLGGIVINDPGAAQSNNTEFILPSVATYRITWHISVSEPTQWALFISSDGLGNAVVAGAPGGLFSQFGVDPSGNYSPTGDGTPSLIGQATGTSEMTGSVILLNPVAGAAIQIRNFASSAGAVTVTVTPGGPNSQSAVLIIERLSG